MRWIAGLVSFAAVVFVQNVMAAAPDPAAQPAATITVALDGTGDFKNVQAAVDSVPAHNTRPVSIHIKPGIYHERITIPADKPLVSFVGDDMAKTVLTASANAHTLGSDGNEIGTFKSASTFIFADDFSARNITFENASGNHGQALAIEVTGDRAVFRHCGFAGWQDTILINAGRQYFEDCAISGHVDFIFGAATAFFNRCQIHCLAPGYITAASTPQDQPFGFVFWHCRVTADGGPASVYLGRPWRPYAQVAFLETDLPDAIRPAGWFNWKDPAREKTARYSEYANTGPGAATAGRVAWSRQLTDAEAEDFTVEKVLAGNDGWNPQPQESDALADPPHTTTPAATEPANPAILEPANPTIEQPLIPNRDFDVTAFGAIGDGKAMNTAALQKAVAACGAAGGGRLVFPAGHFLSCAFTLGSNMELHLDKDATLAFSGKLDDYKLSDRRYEDCLVAKDCHDVAITGPGTIDGQGELWWEKYKKRKEPGSDKAVAPDLPRRPDLIVLHACTRVLLSDVTIENSPSFHLVPERCQDVTIQRIHVTAPADSPNTDGMDPSGQNFLITNSVFDVGDDCIAIKPGGGAGKDHVSCENFTITRCAFLHGHGMSIGSQTDGALRGLLVRDCRFEQTAAGIRMKSNRRVGGVVEDCIYENLTMEDVKIPILITSFYPSIPKNAQDDPAQPITATTPIWRHIRISNVTATGSDVAGQIIGLPEMSISDVVLTNVQIAAKEGMEIIHAKGIRFVDSKITAANGPAVVTHDAQVEGAGSE